MEETFSSCLFIYFFMNNRKLNQHQSEYSKDTLYKLIRVTQFFLHRGNLTYLMSVAYYAKNNFYFYTLRIKRDAG